MATLITSLKIKENKRSLMFDKLPKLSSHFNNDLLKKKVSRSISKDLSHRYDLLNIKSRNTAHKNSSIMDFYLDNNNNCFNKKFQYKHNLLTNAANFKIRLYNKRKLTNYNKLQYSNLVINENKHMKKLRMIMNNADKRLHVLFLLILDLQGY